MKLALRMSLFLAGCAIILLGLNVALGGFETLGWQGDGRFFAITDHELFAIRDNHIRFIAGVWMTVGMLMMVGAAILRQMRTVLLSLIAMIFVGGLMRLSSADADLLSSSDIAPSLIGELVLFPLLGLWIIFATKDEAGA
ncbi:MAG: DUF4345 family protein [Pseudomonadota bacterium]